MVSSVLATNNNTIGFTFFGGPLDFLGLSSGRSKPSISSTASSPLHATLLKYLIFPDGFLLACT